MVFAFVFWVDYLAVQTINQLNLVEVFFTYFRVFQYYCIRTEFTDVFSCFSFSPQAEKNRAAAMANNLQKGSAGPMRLYVGSLHFNITEDMLRGIFEPFGRVCCDLALWACGWSELSNGPWKKFSLTGTKCFHFLTAVYLHSAPQGCKHWVSISEQVRALTGDMVQWYECRPYVRELESSVSSWSSPESGLGLVHSESVVV